MLFLSLRLSAFFLCALCLVTSGDEIFFAKYAPATDCRYVTYALQRF